MFSSKHFFMGASVPAAVPVPAASSTSAMTSTSGTVPAPVTVPTPATSNLNSVQQVPQQASVKGAQPIQPKLLPDFLVMTLDAYWLAVIATDFHGTEDPLKEILRMREVQKYGKKTVIFIAGDILDKGCNFPALYRLIKETNKKHDAGDNVPKIVLSLGNHEAMFLCWISQVSLLMSTVGFTSNMDIAKEMQTPKRDMLFSLLFELCPNSLQEDIANIKSATPDITSLVSKKWLNLLEKLQPLMTASSYVHQSLTKKFGCKAFEDLASDYTANYLPNWLAEFDFKEIAMLIYDLVQLPFIIRVLWQNSQIMRAFNVVHADLPIPLTGIDFVSGKLPELTAEQRYHALWARLANIASTDPDIPQVENLDGNGDTWRGHNILGPIEGTGRGKINANLDSASCATGKSLVALINACSAIAKITSGANFQPTLNQQQLSVFDNRIQKNYSALQAALRIYQPAPMSSSLMPLLSQVEQQSSQPIPAQSSQPAPAPTTTYQSPSHGGLNLHPQALPSSSLPPMFFSISGSRSSKRKASGISQPAATNPAPAPSSPVKSFSSFIAPSTPQP